MPDEVYDRNPYETVDCPVKSYVEIKVTDGPAGSMKQYQKDNEWTGR